jgi:O-succinylbenzoate synthase
MSGLANIPDGPSMLDVFRAWSSTTEGFEAQFVAAQQNDARVSFLETNTARIDEQLALIEMMINQEKQKL